MPDPVSAFSPARPVDTAAAPTAPVAAARAFVVAVCVAVAALHGWLLWAAYRHELAQGRQLTAQAARSSAGHVGTLLRHLDSVVGTLAEVAERELEAGRGGAALDRLMDSLGRDAQHLHELWVRDAQGRVVAHSRPGMTVAFAAQDDYFEAHRRSQASSSRIGMPIRGPGDGAWVLPVTLRLTAPDGRFLGVAAGAVDLEFLLGEFGRLELGRGAATALLDTSARVLVPLPFDERLLGREVGALEWPLHDVKVEGRAFTRAAPDGGGLRIGSVARVPGRRLVMMVDVPRDEVLAPWRTAAAVQTLVVLALIGLLAAIGRRLVRSVEAHARTAAQLGAANVRLGGLMRAIDNHASLLVTDLQGRIVEVNARFCELTGYGPQELVGHPAGMLKSGLHDQAFYEALWTTIRSGAVWRGELLNRAKDGSTYWIDASIVPLAGPDGQPSHYVSIRTDITARKHAEQALEQAMRVLEANNARLARQATLDALTGLANRRRFDEALAGELARSARLRMPVSLVMLDVDHFKRFNDRYGHPAGDQCLRRIATQLARAVRREGDLAARYGGEEFALLLPGTDGAGALRVAEAVRASVQALRIEHAGHPLGVVTLSLGVASLQPAVAGAGAPLLRCADEALYRAKAAGRNRVEVARETDLIGDGA